VVSAVNCGYVGFADNFVAALERLNVTNYILVPLDPSAYTLLREMYPAHTVPLMPSTNLNITTKAASWGQQDFGENHVHQGSRFGGVSLARIGDILLRR